MDKIFFDTETTGLKPGNDRVVEIAAVRYRERKPVDKDAGGEYHVYINPQRDMPAEAFNVHGLSGEFLSDKPVFADVVDSFVAFIEGAEIIAHNAPFDQGMLNAELQRLGKPALENIAAQVTCTLDWARRNITGLSGYSLDALCRRYEVDLSGRKKFHSAVLDAHLLGQVYFRMRQQQSEISISNSVVTINAQGSDIIIKTATPDEVAQHDAIVQRMREGKGAAPIYGGGVDAGGGAAGDGAGDAAADAAGGAGGEA